MTPDQQQRSQRDAIAGDGVATASFPVMMAVLLVAIPWFWPVVAGPIPSMWTDLVAWGSGALLVLLLPRVWAHWPALLAQGWLLASAVSAVLALLQYFDLEGVFSPWVRQTSLTNIIANVHQTNLLASLLAIGLLALGWLHLSHRWGATRCAVLALLLLAGLAATRSRTGLLHVVVIGALALAWGPPRWSDRLRLLALLWLGYGAAALLLPHAQDLFLSRASGLGVIDRIVGESTCGSRLVLWSNVVQLIEQRPWTGWGFGGLKYAFYITPMEGVRFCGNLHHAHNLPLQLAVVWGLPLSAASLLAVGALILALRPWASRPADERLAWAVLLVLGVHSLLEYPLWFGVFQVLLFCNLVLLYGARKQVFAHLPQAGQAALGARLLKLGSVLAIAAMTYVGHDYLRVSQLYVEPAQRLAPYRISTLQKASGTLLFDGLVTYAVINTTPVDPSNAKAMLDAALLTLRSTPDPVIIEKLIAAARLLGELEVAAFHENRYREMWPAAWQTWKSRQAP